MFWIWMFWYSSRVSLVESVSEVHTHMDVLFHTTDGIQGKWANIEYHFVLIAVYTTFCEFPRWCHGNARWARRRHGARGTVWLTAISLRLDPGEWPLTCRCHARLEGSPLGSSRKSQSDHPPLVSTTANLYLSVFQCIAVTYHMCADAACIPSKRHCTHARTSIC